MPPSPHPAGHFTRPEPWRPMTDAEWDALSCFLSRDSGPRRGRPPADPRATWDAIFWVACSSGPWTALPAGLGKADTAHRALRRAATIGRLGFLLFALARKAAPALAAMEWRIVRAYRRMFRVMPGQAIAIARRLGLLSALPCHPDHLPRPEWQPVLERAARTLLAARPFRIHPRDSAVIRALHRIVGGDARRWATTD